MKIGNNRTRHHLILRLIIASILGVMLAAGHVLSLLRNKRIGRVAILFRLSFSCSYRFSLPLDVVLTRAMICLGQLHIKQAIQFNPLSLPLLLAMSPFSPVTGNFPRGCTIKFALKRC